MRVFLTVLAYLVVSSILLSFISLYFPLSLISSAAVGLVVSIVVYKYGLNLPWPLAILLVVLPLILAIVLSTLLVRIIVGLKSLL